jgi:spore protease
VAVSIRTDLALEAHEALGRRSVPGVRVVEERPLDDVLVTRVTVESDEGARELGKPIGRYVTVESKRLRKHDRDHAMAVGKVLSAELAAMVEPHRPRSVLVVGLGNWNATPDALGPKVVNRVLVTRHLDGVIEDELKAHLCSVAAIAPGVLGLTGMETSEIVHGVVDRIHPDLVIAIDALAAGNVERIAATIQVADTGIHPGSGVGNHRSGLTSDTLGCPVIAIGVPTVVHATTIARDAVEAFLRLLRREGDPSLREALGRVEVDELLEEVVKPSMADLMVTPKEIDAQIEDLSRLIAGAINTSLHAEIDLGEFALYA